MNQEHYAYWKKSQKSDTRYDHLYNILNMTKLQRMSTYGGLGLVGLGSCCDDERARGKLCGDGIVLCFVCDCGYTDLYV